MSGKNKDPSKKKTSQKLENKDCESVAQRRVEILTSFIRNEMGMHAGDPRIVKLTAELEVARFLKK